MNIFFILALLAALGSLFTVFAGTINMARSSQNDRKNSNKLMQLRVGLQACAVLFAAIAFSSD